MSHVSKIHPFFNFLILKLRYDGQKVETVQSTTYGHNMIFHLASYRGQPFTTGSWTGHSKTEIMNLQTGKWISAPDYPFHSS